MTKSKSLLTRILRGVLWLALALVVISLLAIWQIGAWNILFPSHQHDSTAPTIPASVESPAVLLFSKTNSFRHKDGIEGGTKAFEAMAKKRGWSLFATENGAVFNADDLSRFGAVVFLNASGDMLDSAQEQAFQTWLEAGGGWLGVHAAGDSSHAEWQWYRDNLIGADFTAHIMGPQFQRATVLLENQVHPVLAGLPDIWHHTEEWYSWEKSPRGEGFVVLATLDEDSYTPEARILGSERDLRMVDHPVVWSNCIGMGRSVYAAMGHKAEAFEQPQVRRLLDNALVWLLDKSGTRCEDAAVPESP